MSAEQIRKCAMLLILVVCTWQDLKRRQVFVPVPAAGSAAGIFLTLVYRDCFWGSIAGGAAAGLMVIGFGLLSKEKIGIGDGWVLMACGCLEGISSMMIQFMSALFFAMAASAFLLAAKKKRRTDTMPFLPFLLAAFVIDLMI